MILLLAMHFNVLCNILDCEVFRDVIRTGSFLLFFDMKQSIQFNCLSVEFV